MAIDQSDSHPVVWVSGGSAGIGRAVIDSTPWKVARRICLSRSPHPDAETIQVDLSVPSNWKLVIANFHEVLDSGTYSRAVFIHSAASLEVGGFAGEVDMDRYTQQVLLNAAAPLVLGSGFIEAVEVAGIRGDLVMLTSGAANRPSTGWSTYGPAKAAMDAWVKTVADERAARGSSCRVVGISPGPTDTGMQADIRSSDSRGFPRKEEFVRLQAEGKLAPSSTIARSIWEIVQGDLTAGSVYDVRPK